MTRNTIMLAVVAVCLSGKAHASNLDEEVMDALPQVRDAYEFLHAHPELGKQEQMAHAFIRDRLKTLGFTRFVESASAPTAVIAVLETGRPGPVIALRAEMDGRSLEEGLEEPEDHAPRSAVPGRMHNCGHDVHAAMLLGAAAVLKRRSDMLSGKIVFLFQPAEETPGGADDIIHDGLLSTLGVQRIFAQHVAPSLPVGALAVAPGAILAGSSYFEVTLKGRGAHAAAPWNGDDVGLLMTHLAQNLSYLPARRRDIANRPAVVSITQMTADGGASNALPAQAELKGTIRAFEDPQVGENELPSLTDHLKATVESFGKMNGVAATWSFRAGSPPTTNDAAVFDATIPILSSAWKGRIDTSPARGMFSEDFAFYTKSLPALYFALGVNGGKYGNAGVHTAEFTVHPDTLEYGTRLMVLLGLIGTTGRSDLPPRQ